MTKTEEPTPASPGGAIAFEGERRIAAGPIGDVAVAVKAATEAGPHDSLLVFDLATSQVIDLDLRGTADEVRQRVAPTTDPQPTAAAPRRGPGRPKLGVVSREITLLPRHWRWLSEQPGGASVTLRKLVDQARVANADKDRVRQGREAAYRFMLAMAGDREGFEEASRSLFAGDAARFTRYTETWPADIRDHSRDLASVTFGQGAPAEASAD